MSENKEGIPSIDELLKKTFGGFNPFNKNEKIIDKNIKCSVSDCGAIATFKCPECGKLVCEIFHTRGKYCYNCTKEGLEIEELEEIEEELTEEEIDAEIEELEEIEIEEIEDFRTEFTKELELTLKGLNKSIQDKINEINKLYTIIEEVVNWCGQNCSSEQYIEFSAFLKEKLSELKN